MALLGSALTGDVGLRLLLCPLGSHIVIRAACCTVGIALPVYSTFKAIEKKDQNEHEKWLLYWTAYGSFSIVEVFSDKLVSWFPLYYHMKFAFLVWLQLPSNNGSRHIYERHLRPFLLRHQARLDQLLGSASSEMAKFISTHQEEIRLFRALVGRCVLTANQLVKGIIQPVQPRGQNAVEGPRSLPSQQIQDLDVENDD